MRIQLKQFEIEAALKGYLAKQGIAVTDKTVTMDFTAGRKNKGISVEVVIEDAVLVGNNPEQVTVDEAQEAPAPKPEPAAFPAFAGAESPAVEGTVADEAKPAASPSLFG